MSKNRGTTAPKVTAELNFHLEDRVPKKMVQCELHKSNIHSRAAIAKPLITENNDNRRKDGVIVIQPGCLMIGNMKYGLISHPSHCFKHQAGFMFGKCPRKLGILNAWYQV